MSHITRVTTRLKDLRIIKLALKDLEIEFEEGAELSIPEVSGFVELLIRLPRNRHPIGLLRNQDGSFRLEGEQSAINLAEEMDLINKLSQRYAYHLIKEKLASQGFQLESETESQEKSIHLTLRRVT